MMAHHRRVLSQQGCFAHCVQNNAAGVEVPTLMSLCLRSLESSLGKGLASLSLQGLPLGLAEKIYRYVALSGSRMAQMEITKALSPLLSHMVSKLDCSATVDESEQSDPPAAVLQHNSDGSCSGGGIIGESALFELANGCGAGLMSLDLGGCRLISNTGVLRVLSTCPNLLFLGLSGLDRVTDEALYLVPHQISCLTRLNLAGLSGVTASGVAYLSFLPSLEQLSLARCCQIGDEALTALGRGNCRESLQWLDLSGTATTDAGASTSLRHMKRLQFISLSSNSVSLSTVNSLARDLDLPAALPDAPKSRARCSRSLLMGSRWSRRQSSFAPRRTPNPARGNGMSLRYGHGTAKHGWEGRRSRLLRAGTAGTVGG
ncbi:unnamed protein product, partial [Sphacelaria rigidula]